MFLDQATIFVRAGRGGDGCVSLRREKYVPKGGPDGGTGGRGGHVILFADAHENTLLSLARNPHQRAKNGMPGEGNNRHGADGEDLPTGSLTSHRSGRSLHRP